MIDQHLAVLQIVVPLIAAPICMLVGSRRRVMALVIGVTWVVLAMATRLLYLVTTQGVLLYQLGGWPAPWGIEYRVDALSGLYIWLIAAISTIVVTYAPLSVDHEIEDRHHSLFYTTYLLCVTGLMGITITGDLFNLFVFLEISSLSSYALIAMGRGRRALVAAFQYLIMGTLGATFILIGIGLCYQLTGSLNMEDLSRILLEYTQAGRHRTVLVAFAFLSVGISLKMALFPLHQWLPNAYACAPSVVTALLAATSTKVSVYIMLRVIFTVFQPHFAFDVLPLDRSLMVLSLVGIFVASICAIFQKDVKRLLAYSSVAQIGYIVLGLSLASVSGVTASVLHVCNHAMIKGGLFLAMGCFAYRLPSLSIDQLHGVGRRMPLTTLAWVLGGLGLIGVPVTSGFISKWFLVVAILEADLVWAVLMVLVGSLLAVVYVWRVVEVAYFRPPNELTALATEAPLPMLIPTYVLIGASLFFGVWPSITIGFAHRAALAILGGQ